jgi:hypothetical protein
VTAAWGTPDTPREDETDEQKRAWAVNMAVIALSGRTDYVAPSTIKSLAEDLLRWRKYGSRS